MAYVPYAPEIGAAYTLTNAVGATVTFNNPADPNYGGILSDITGLDSPDVRESGDVLVASDGGWQGNNYFGRRPITMTGQLGGVLDAADRAVKLDRIRQASTALRSDAILSWTNTAVGAVPMQTWVRRQQPLRFSGGWSKTFNLMLVAAFAPLFSVALHTSASGTNITVENQGNWPSFPIITVHGTVSGGTPVVITNATTGFTMRMLTGYTQGSTDSLAIDMLNHTAVLNGGTTYNSYIDFVNSSWPAVIKGNNTFTLTGATSMSLVWRDAWS